MVGCATFTTKTNGLPATIQSFLDNTASGPGTGCAAGATPGQIGTWVCPGDGFQTFVCALRVPHARTVQRAKMKSFITIVMVTGWCERSTKRGLSQKSPP